MLRIPNLLRSKLPKQVPMRAGLPGWHRPDPPPSVDVPLDHELSDEEIVFHFFDRNMPEFFITQPEVYEGDTLLEATPMLLKGIGLWVGLGLIIGTSLYLTSPFRSTRFSRPSIEEKYENQVKVTESRQWLKWGRKNQIGIQLSSEYYPQYREGVNDVADNYKQLKKNIDSYAVVNKEAKDYFTKLRQKCQHIVEQRLAHPEAHADAHAHENHH